MLKNDTWIKESAKAGMIEPFVDRQVRTSELGPVLSFGLSSFGYDIRLSPQEFWVFKHIPGTIVDPKRFSPGNLEYASLHHDDSGQFFILPAHSYGLGVALERLDIPRDVTILCVGKSTYARCGIIANVTPAEAGWKGHLTLEFSNSSSTDARIYAGEGILQLLFLEGKPCQISYEDRQGKYQEQSEQVTIAKV